MMKRRFLTLQGGILVSKELSLEEREQLLSVLEERFHHYMDRHPMIEWKEIEEKIVDHQQILWSLHEMEKTGGEPDVVVLGDETMFVDCVKETPKGRRSLCYDRAALEARKKHKPESSVEDVAREMGVEILNEQQYRNLQQYGPFDQKTSTWIQTPDDIRAKGGALFCDYRYGHVFVYHNGADSYYSSRAFRGFVKI